MTAADLIRRLCLAGVELRVKGADLVCKAPAGVLTPEVAAEIRTHKPELMMLLDGTTCRWCRHPIDWRHMPDAVALGDGTSLHGGCREPFHVDRIIHSAARAVAPALAADPGEVVFRGMGRLTEAPPVAHHAPPNRHEERRDDDAAA